MLIAAGCALCSLTGANSCWLCLMFADWRQQRAVGAVGTFGETKISPRKIFLLMKYKFYKQELIFLRYKISREGILIDPVKYKAV